jgi:dipeptidyl aminopeptidase/acylaminoacyl peptidase
MFEVSEKTCPLETVETTTPDGVKVVGVLRKPPGPGPFPALIQLHGGLQTENMTRLRSLATQPTMSRFLAAGYLIVAPTFRDREEDPQTRDALADCLAMIDYVKHRPDVDAKSVVVWGDSGGGSLAIELAGETSLAAVAAQEPATILMIGIMTKENKNKGPLMQDPKKYWTLKLQALTREKISKIQCPIFIAYGDKSQINDVNHQIVIPELKAAGKQLETKLYPGQRHAFSKASQEFFGDASQFFAKYLVTQPQAVTLH